jgi:hypothetical protein
MDIVHILYLKSIGQGNGEALYEAGRDAPKIALPLVFASNNIISASNNLKVLPSPFNTNHEEMPHWSLNPPPSIQCLLSNNRNFLLD